MRVGILGLLFLIVSFVQRKGKDGVRRHTVYDGTEENYPGDDPE
jgi:hypothetical protein